MDRGVLSQSGGHPAWSRLSAHATFTSRLSPATSSSPVVMTGSLFYTPFSFSQPSVTRTTVLSSNLPSNSDPELLLAADVLTTIASASELQSTLLKSDQLYNPAYSNLPHISFSVLSADGLRPEIPVQHPEDDNDETLGCIKSEAETSTEREDLETPTSKIVIQSINSDICVENAAKAKNTNSKLAPSPISTYRCRECTRKLDSAEALESHKEAHNKEKQFACPHCEYRSKTHNALDKHLLTHSASKLFNCPLCSYGTNYKDHLDGHIREHKGIKAFQCDQCDFKCNRKSHMNRHKLTHNPTKPFNCQLCSYGANRKEHLEAHMYKHSGTKPFQCPHCQFACSDQHYLNRHIRTSH